MADIQKALYDIQGNRITPETVAEAVDYDNTESGLTATDIQGAVDELESEKIANTSIADNLTTDDATKVLSAKQGKVLKDAADTLTGRVTTNETGIADRYTKQQAVQKFAYLEEAEGNSIQILDTIDAPFAELEILGETLATPTDPEQEVSPDNPQTLSSLTSFDYTAENADASETITKSISLKDTSDNQLEARGIPATYNPDGSVATWAVQDKIVKGTDGKWKLNGNTQKVTYNGSETWAYYGASADSKYVYTVYTNDGEMRYGSSMCSHFSNKAVVSGSLVVGQYRDGVGADKRRFLCSDQATVADFKTWLALNNITLVYKLSTPTYTELCAADQTALNEIEAQGTFDGTTNIMLSTEVGEVNVKGAKDITKVISDMASAIALLG